MTDFERSMHFDPASMLLNERQQFSDMDEYLESIINTYRESEWVKVIENLAYFVEPKDDFLATDPEFPAANAFLRGAILGLRVVTDFAAPDIQAKMLQVDVGLDNQDVNPQSRLATIANSILAFGECGFNQSSEISPIIRAWEDELEPQILYQPYVHRGFGIMMYMMHEARELIITEAFEKTLDSGTDWDKELRELTGEV